MEKYESIEGIDRQAKGTLRFFTGWVLIAQIFGLISVVMVAVWMGHFRGGFAWTDDPAREFNYHPLFMIIGMVFLYGNCELPDSCKTLKFYFIARVSSNVLEFDFM